MVQKVDNRSKATPYRHLRRPLTEGVSLVAERGRDALGAVENSSPTHRVELSPAEREGGRGGTVSPLCRVCRADGRS
jgi:hypothetical protein